MNPLHPTHRRRAVALALLALALSHPAARADDDGRRTATPLLPAYSEECGACHVAFPPAALPAASWQRLMANLERHFGTDASLDPQLTQTLSLWLQAGAAQGRRAAGPPPPEDRITRSTWFLREHDELSAAVWQRPAIGSPSNCNACHTRAAEGSYREHDIRISR